MLASAVLAAAESESTEQAPNTESETPPDSGSTDKPDLSTNRENVELKNKMELLIIEVCNWLFCHYP